MRRTVILAFLLAALVPAVVLAQQTADNSDDEGVLVRVNGSDTVESGERIGVAVVVDGNLDIAGEVTGAAVVVNGNVSALGGSRIEGTVVVVDGSLILRDGSVVTGDIYLADDSTWVMEEGATFTGEVNDGSLALGIGNDVAWQLAIIGLAGWLGATLLTIGAAVVFAGIGGRQLWTSAGYLTIRPGATILTTVSFWFGLGLVTVPLALSFVGAIMLPVVAIIGLVVWFLGYVTFATRIGAWITGERMADSDIGHPYLASIAGSVVLQIVLLIAVGSALASMLTGLLDDGNTGLGVAFGIPAVALYVALWIVGLIGGGALILRALNAWSANG